MSIQVTIELSRKQAEFKLLTQIKDQTEVELKKVIEKLSNKQLENELEETYYNYSIKE